VDPNNPKTLVVETHNIDYKRKITVYIPAQYNAGSESPFQVIHDGPGWRPNAELLHIFDNLIAQKRIPPIIVIWIANGGGDAQGHERGTCSTRMLCETRCTTGSRPIIAWPRC
jgi:enterochelin esterase family protein